MNDEHNDLMFDASQYNQIPKAESLILDPATNEIKGESELTPWEKMVQSAETYGIKINDPKENCKKCYGRGYIGIDTNTRLPIPCKCIFPPATPEQKMQELMQPPQFMNRAMKRRIEKMQLRAKRKSK